MEPVADSAPLSTVKHQTFHVPLSAIPANVLSQLQEVPSSVSSARIFRLPPGVVLVKPTVANLVTATNANATTPASAGTQPVLQLQSDKLVVGAPISEIPISAKQGAAVKLNDRPNKRIVLLKSPAGNILSRANLVAPVNTRPVQNCQAVPSTSTTAAFSSSSVAPGVSIRLEKEPHGVLPSKPSVGDTLTPIPIYAKPARTALKGPPPLVPCSEKQSEGKKEPSTTDSSSTKAKPKQWCREPRPLWKSKEPVVLYSGCKPENLEPKKKKEEPPKSLPCPQKLDVSISLLYSQIIFKI